MLVSPMLIDYGLNQTSILSAQWITVSIQVQVSKPIFGRSLLEYIKSGQ